jgi:hypothetical protein
MSTGQYMKQLTGADDAVWAVVTQMRQAAGLKSLRRN